MTNDISDIYELLATLKGNIFSLEQTVSEQSAEISRLHRIIHQKDKRIQALEKENKKLREGLSVYEKPDKDSHNSSIAPSQESIKSKAVRRTSSLRQKSTLKS